MIVNCSVLIYNRIVVKQKGAFFHDWPKWRYFLLLTGTALVSVAHFDIIRLLVQFCLLANQHQMYMTHFIVSVFQVSGTL